MPGAFSPKHDRDIFISGKYIPHFAPDEQRNPFRKIYHQKKCDAAEIIREISAIRVVKRILDVGGGMGRLSLMLAQAETGTIVLTDISADMLSLAKRQAGDSDKLQLVNADAHNLPFPDGSFDVVVGLDLFCHLANPDLALAEFSRVLVEPGTLILDSTNSNPLWAIFYPRYLGKNPLTWIRVMWHKGILPGWESIVRHYPRKTFISFLVRAGFKVTGARNYGPAICPKWHLTVSQK